MNRRDVIKAAIAAPVAVAAGTRAHASEAEPDVDWNAFDVELQPALDHVLTLPMDAGPVMYTTQYMDRLVVFTESGRVFSISHRYVHQLAGSGTLSMRELPFGNGPGSREPDPSATRRAGGGC